MDSRRLPRFARSIAIAPILITARDREIIKQIHRHRFLQSAQVGALVGGSSQQILRRLQLLYHHGFLDRPRAQLDYYHQGGSRQLVYGLGSKGVALLKGNLGAAVRQTRLGGSNRTVGRVFLEHALLVSTIMVAIELACRNTGIVRLIHADELRQNAPLPSFRWSVQVSANVNLGVIPDGVFGLEWKDQSGGPARSFFFLEADRGTMPVTRGSLTQTSFYRKLLAYEATWSQSLHRIRFDFHRFRVLTVTNSAERVEALISACARLERGRGLFLFADRNILEKPGQILSSVWQSGVGDSPGSPLD